MTPRAAAETRDAHYPFSLNTGRLRDHWHGLSRTGTLGRLSGHATEPTLDMVQQASTARERRLVTTLGRLVADAEDAGIASPAVLIVGDVLQGVLAAQEADVRVPHSQSAPRARSLRT